MESGYAASPNGRSVKKVAAESNVGDNGGDLTDTAGSDI
jgi:hypothetical protein